ncbi:hypothetical protein SLA2020_156230 [Shorea laevis]
MMRGSPLDSIQINTADCNPPSAPMPASATTVSTNPLALDSENDYEDLELFQSIRSHLAISDDVCDPF